MKRFKLNSILATLAVLISVLFTVASFHPLFATSGLTVQDGVNAARGAGQPSDLFGNDGVFTTITNTLLFAVGILSVVMIIIGGLRYVVSGGNATAVSGAKNTIMYAIVGLVVSFLAYAIINYILGSLAGTGSGGTNV